MYLDLFTFLCLAVAAVGIFVFMFFLFVLSTNKKVQLIRYDEEKHFKDPSSPGTLHQFPSLSDPASVDLSVVIPSYNEEQRLPIMLDECLEFLENRVSINKHFTYEVIVVDDGSADRTTEVAMKYAKKMGIKKFRVLTLIKNRGKGGAVRLGMLSTRGKHLLFADADGATKFPDLVKLEEAMNGLQDPCVVIGSRAHLEKESVASRSAFRTFLMFGFHSLVWIFGVRGVRDTQCGFKLFTRKSASMLFPALHVERWAFDVELLYLAKRMKMPIVEVAVNWTEIEGSKLVPVWSWLQMGKDLITIWLKYQLRVWTVNAKKD